MNDHRSRKVEISPEGQAQVAAIQRRFGGAFEVLLKDWSNSDLNRFTSDLQKLIKRMEEMRAAAQP
jgi:DNA-binding MarR family transcriptional regulator